MPEALMASTTSPGPGVGSGNSMCSILRLPANTTARISILPGQPGSGVIPWPTVVWRAGVGGGNPSLPAARGVEGDPPRSRWAVSGIRLAGRAVPGRDLRPHDVAVDRPPGRVQHPGGRRLHVVVHGRDGFFGPGPHLPRGRDDPGRAADRPAQGPRPPFHRDRRPCDRLLLPL